MSSAYLATTRNHRAQPDRVRITALAVAVTINLTVFVAATRPLPPLALPHVADSGLDLRWIEPPKPQPPPPPLEVRPLPQPVQAPRVAPPHAAAPQVSDEARLVAPPVTAPTLAPPSTGNVQDAVPASPVEASLAYRSAPLSFPTQAIRQHMHGTVLLRVLVDEQGRPIEVLIEQSSGYGLLDRSARAQVLAGWRFQPALLDGRAVRAWARVPVSFELRKL